MRDEAYLLLRSFGGKKASEQGMRRDINQQKKVHLLYNFL